MMWTFILDLCYQSQNLHLFLPVIFVKSTATSDGNTPANVIRINVYLYLDTGIKLIKTNDQVFAF